MLDDRVVHTYDHDQVPLYDSTNHTTDDTPIYSNDIYQLISVSPNQCVPYVTKSKYCLEIELNQIQRMYGT